MMGNIGTVFRHDLLHVLLEILRFSISSAESRYTVRTAGENSLEVWVGDPDHYFRITYDNQSQQMVNVELVKQDPEPTPKP